MIQEPPPADQLVVETRRYYGEVFRTAWHTVALSSAFVVVVVFFNSRLFVPEPGAGQGYIRFSVGPNEGLAFLGVLSAIVISLVVEVDQSARLLSRPDQREMPGEELGLRTVRLRLAQWTSTALGYGAVICGLLVVFTSEQDVFEARAALTALAAGLVFAFTLLVNLAAENAQALLRELNRRSTELMYSRIEYWRGQLESGQEADVSWRQALADFWSDSGTYSRAAVRRLVLWAEGFGIRRWCAVCAGLLVAAMTAAVALFGWGAMVWVGLSGVVWFGMALVGFTFVMRDVFAGTRALPSVELLFLSIVAIILSGLVWISNGGTESVGLVDLEHWGVIIAIVPALLFAAFAVTSAVWLLLMASGAFGRLWLTERVIRGLDRRARVLGDSLGT